MFESGLKCQTQVKKDAKKYVETLKKKEDGLAVLLVEKENTIATLEAELKSVQCPRPTIEVAMITDVHNEEQAPTRTREAGRRLAGSVMDDGEEVWSHRTPESPGAEDASQACTACQSGIFVQSDEDTVSSKLNELLISLADREAKLVNQTEQIREMEAKIAWYTAERGTDSGVAASVLPAPELGWAERRQEAQKATAAAVHHTQEEQAQLRESGYRRAEARELQFAVDALNHCVDALEALFQSAAGAAAGAVAEAREQAIRERAARELQEVAGRDAERRAAASAAEAAEAVAEEARLRKEEGRAAARELARQKRGWDEERAELEERLRASQEAEGRSKERAERCREESRKALDRAEEDIRRAEEREALLQARIEALVERQQPQVAAPDLRTAIPPCGKEARLFSLPSTALLRFHSHKFDPHLVYIEPRTIGGRISAFLTHASGLRRQDGETGAGGDATGWPEERARITEALKKTEQELGAMRRRAADLKSREERARVTARRAIEEGKRSAAKVRRCVCRCPPPPCGGRRASGRCSCWQATARASNRDSRDRECERRR
jgi:hypothetical protein